MTWLSHHLIFFLISSTPSSSHHRSAILFFCHYTTITHHHLLPRTINLQTKTQKTSLNRQTKTQITNPYHKVKPKSRKPTNLAPSSPKTYRRTKRSHHSTTRCLLYIRNSKTLWLILGCSRMVIKELYQQCT